MTLAERIARTNYVRGRFRNRQHREWFHFYILTPDVDLIANFNLTFDPEFDSATHYRIVALARVGETWTGDVTKASHAVAPSGGTGLLSDNGGFELHRDGIDVMLATEDVQCRLRLTPLTEPVHTNSVSFSGDQALRWIAVPHLVANGTIEVAGRSHDIVDANAYHDHNWGQFRWGDDFSWEWIGFTSDDRDDVRYSGVFTRMSDRYAHTTLSQSLFAWRNGNLMRVLSGGELEVHRTGLKTIATKLRVPRVARLALPGEHDSLPERIDIRSTTHHPSAAISVTPNDNVQVLVPNDADDESATLISESRCNVRGALFDNVARRIANLTGVGLLEQINSVRLR